MDDGKDWKKFVAVVRAKKKSQDSV